MPPAEDDLVAQYLELGLRLGRLAPGLVDAYYGPRELADRVAASPVDGPDALVARAARLIADLDAATDGALDPGRRRWLRDQVRGLHTTARREAGARLSYVEEVEGCYGVRPSPVDEEHFAAAHRELEAVVPGVGSLAERYDAWREAQTVPIADLSRAVGSLAEDFRARTREMFGLPDGEAVTWELVTDKPWSGFNHYEGDLRSTVAINTDLPVPAPTLVHLVAHEAYPGHHTEHVRKEVGLVRRRRQLEETIFLVGTPQCLLAEGLADLGVEVLLGAGSDAVLAEHLRPLGIAYDVEVAAAVRAAAETLGAVRGNAAWLLHERGRPVDEVVAYLRRWSLLSDVRARKAVEFLTDPTWRAYVICYVEGLARCRAFVGGDPTRFERLLREQLVPADLDPA